MTKLSTPLKVATAALALSLAGCGGSTTEATTTKATTTEATTTTITEPPTTTTEAELVSNEAFFVFVMDTVSADDPSLITEVCPLWSIMDLEMKWEMVATNFIADGALDPYPGWTDDDYTINAIAWFNSECEEWAR